MSPKDKETNINRTFIISVSLAIILTLSGIFMGMAVRTRQLIDDTFLHEARAHFKSIVLTRKWNAKYGGVYVEKRHGVESNPYLENPDILGVDGKVYTKRHPALMTREISEYAEKEGLFKFHITSLNPLNPANRPDEFESKALALFDEGEEEFAQIETFNNKRYFRYMAPLYVDEECLQCHSKQGYKLGEVRGGISVMFDIEHVQGDMKNNLLAILFSAIAIILLILALIFLFMKKFLIKLSHIRKQIEEMAVTDELTGIPNRRSIISRFREEFERAKRLDGSLGCIILDIDHFKEVNDRYGHLFGDEALKKVATISKDSIRTYDSVGRIGGEEFLFVLPDADFEETRNLAERMRKNIQEKLIQKTEQMEDVKVMVSLGITTIQDQDESIDHIIKRADQGLYKAKSTGRNRVEWIPV
jgi:diguanylate cyclase (GGDEF)-like protein